MHYMCNNCEQIYQAVEDALGCCPPEVTPIPDDQVVYCPNCHGDGCETCHDHPIQRKQQAALAHRFSAAILAIKTET
jgi:hypothetical protein